MAKPLLLFAHGAGAPSTSTWMQGWCARLSPLGKVVTFDYPYMQQGRRRPDRHERLLQAHIEQLQKARKRLRRPIVLLGKSMGGRIGCHVALSQPVDAVVCFGYPLVSMSGKVRDQVLLQLQTPILFLQGTRDRLCPLDQLERVRQQMTASNRLHVVDTGDHSLLATKTWLKQNGSSQEQVDSGIASAIERFFADQLPS